MQIETVGVPSRPIEVELIDVAFDPDPQAVAADQSQMMTLVTILVGPPPDGGGEIFCATFCTPEWLAAQCQNGSFVPVGGVLMVRSEDFDEVQIRREIERFLSQIREQTWGEVAERIKEWFPYWEIDGYAPITPDGHADL
ncbi:MAG TPA: Imm8 family immunity protein [Acidimicrobiales bacterium]|nr:Imm8 family immunity protein [Acidimicrobiales bacterium]